MEEPTLQPKVSGHPKKIVYLSLLLVGVGLVTVISLLVLKLNTLQKANSKLEFDYNRYLAVQKYKDAEDLNKAEAPREILLSKEIEGGKIVAYRLHDSWSTDLNGGVFAVKLESGDYRPVVFSSVSSALTSSSSDQNKIFDIVNDNEVWVVNSQTNKIDVYSFSIEKLVDGVTYPSSLTFKESQELPNYAVGKIYTIACEPTTCKVNTALHQESGCSMVLNLNSRSYSDIKCANSSGDFVPSRL